MSSSASLAGQGVSPLAVEPFSYSSVLLPSATDHVRLLTLLPPDNIGDTATDQERYNSPLKCRIVAAPLQSPPPYQAISYVWGCDDKTHHLLLSTTSDDENNLLITASLDLALRQLRHPSRGTTMWIDQVCINQDDIPEKNAQVAVMGDVYANASEVIIWLGPDDDGSMGRFMGRMEVGAKLARAAGIGNLFGPGRNEDKFWQFMTTVTSTSLDEPADSDPVVGLIRQAAATFITTNEEKLAISAELRAWFGRPWFGRVWVLQEYILSKNAIFVCGRSRIDTESFELAHNVLCIMSAGQQGIKAPNPGDAEALLALGAAVGFDPLSLLAKLRRRYQQGGPHHSLCWLLRDIYGLGRAPVHSKDQRDRIFALLGLAGDAVALGITPDYSPTLTIDALYTKVSRAILSSNGGDLGLLELIRFPKRITGESHLLLKLPSWVPDFQCPQESFSLPSKEANGQWFYCPTGNDKEPRLSFPHENVLGIEGIFVDKVEAVGQPWLGSATESNEPGTHSNHDPRKCCEYFGQVSPLCARSNEKFKLSQLQDRDSTDPIYATEQRRQEAPYRTILGDIASGASHHYTRASSSKVDALKDLLKAGEIVRDIAHLAANHSGGSDRDDPDSAANAAFVAKMREYATNFRELLTLEVGALATRLEHMRNRAPFLTEAGYVGMGPLLVSEGDIVVLFYGARTPYVLRPRRSGGEREFELVGEAYCDGVMDGELADRPGEWFNLV